MKEGKPQAGDRLLTALREKASPQLSRINREIQGAIKQINLPGWGRLNYDQTLEKHRSQFTWKPGIKSSWN